MKKARKERIFPFSPIFSTAPRPPPRVSTRNTPKTGKTRRNADLAPEKQNHDDFLPLAPRRSWSRRNMGSIDDENILLRAPRHSCPPLASSPTALATNENAPQSGAPCHLCRCASLSCIFVIFRHFSSLFVTFRQISTCRLLRKFSSFSLANAARSAPYASGVRSTA